MKKTEIELLILLTKPTTGVDFGLQKGSGNVYQTVQKQRADSGDLSFQFTIEVKGDKQKDALPKFSGPFVQGPTGNKFIYIDIGMCAGQTDSIWSRRLKVPLAGITWNDIDKLNSKSDIILETRIPGTGRDGGPNCATVKPFEGWHITEL